jgi:hypothetical protein
VCPDRAPPGGVERCEETLARTIDPLASDCRQSWKVRDRTDLGTAHRRLGESFAPQGQSVDMQCPVAMETVIAAVPADFYPFCRGSACSCQHIAEAKSGELVGHRGRQDFDTIEIARSCRLQQYRVKPSGKQPECGTSCGETGAGDDDRQSRSHVRYI